MDEHVEDSVIASAQPAKKDAEKREAGLFKGRYELGPDFFAPLSQDELALWES
jgi:hypothetical protein